MPDRQANDQILWLQVQRVVRGHRDDHMSWRALDLFEDSCIRRERHPKQTNDETTVCFTKLITVPECVANSRGIRVEAHVPHKILVPQLGRRIYFYFDAEQMAYPSRNYQAKRCQPTSPGGEIEGHVECIAALPVEICIFLAEHIDLRLGDA